MSYPPPYNNGQYPPQFPQYLQQLPPNPTHPPQQQPVPQQHQYNVSPNVPYQSYPGAYGYPQVVLPQYGSPYGQQHLQQQLPPPPPPQQFQSPVTHQHQHQQHHQQMPHPLPPQSPQIIHQQHQQRFHSHSPIVQQQQLQQQQRIQAPQPLQQPPQQQHAQLHPQPQQQPQPQPQPPQHQHQHQPPPVPQQPQQPQQSQPVQQPPPLQFVNPADTFTAPTISSGPSLQYTHGPPPAPSPVSKYAASPPIPARQPLAQERQYTSMTPPTTTTPFPSQPTQPVQPTATSQPQERRTSSSPFSLVPQVVIPSPAHLQQKMAPKAPAVQGSMPVPASASASASAPAPAPTPPVHQVAPQAPPQPAPDEDIDYQTLLLALADEYLNAAHGKGTSLALSTNSADLADYYKLVATGLGCLEAVQMNFRLPPRTEALTRLRYARILVEETDNDVEAETALSKGIEVCERNKLVDLKYTMQQLLARMLHKSNPKAAVKAVDAMIQEVETYRYVPWEYAFRLLRVSLALSSGSHQEFVHAVHNLQKLSALASRNGDKLMAVVASLVEALAHLQLSTNADSVEQAQNAVAAARSHQLDPSVQDIPQIGSMVQMVDISCSLLEYDLSQASQKLQIMQTLMDQRINDSRWRDDGTFSIPLSRSPPPTQGEMGDILRVEEGKLCLTLSWLPQHDLYALCYFLSSVTLGSKNSHDGRKAEKYLQEGLRMIRSNFKAPEDIKESFVAAGKRLEWRRTLYCNMLLHQVFLACARTDWDAASQILKDLHVALEELGDATSETVKSLMQYATGVIAQGSGDLTGALAAFESPLLSLSSSSRTARNDPRRDTAILAALNTVLIIREPSHYAHGRLNEVLSTVEPLCLGSSNKYIQAAYYLVCAIVHTDSTIQTKQYLQQALQSATAISNSQITCVTLTFMSWKYFRGVVGEQSEKSARASRAMAKKANDRLWVSVTDQLLSETLDRQGKTEEARNVREEADRVLMGLPAALKHTE